MPNRAERSPFEPEQDNTCGGKSENVDFDSVLCGFFARFVGCHSVFSSLFFFFGFSPVAGACSVITRKSMTVFVNNQSVETQATASLRSLLAELTIADKKGIAVAINNAIIPRAAWEQFALSGNEKITILQATQGG